MTSSITKIRAALEMARDYITSDLASERGAFEGYEGLSRIGEIKADIEANDEDLAALAELEPVAWQYRLDGDGAKQRPKTTGIEMTDIALKFMFEVGRQYETQSGDLVTVLGRSALSGYECLICSDGKHRYDRSTSNSDAGRVTGTAHDYSCHDNFKRGNKADIVKGMRG